MKFNLKGKLRNILVAGTAFVSMLGVGATSVAAYPATVVTTPGYGIRLYNDNGQATDNFILNGTSWAVLGTRKTTDGIVYNKVGNNQWQIPGI